MPESEFTRLLREQENLARKRALENQQAAARMAVKAAIEEKRKAEQQKIQDRRNKQFLGTDPAKFWGPEDVQSAADFLKAMRRRSYRHSRKLLNRPPEQSRFLGKSAQGYLLGTALMSDGGDGDLYLCEDQRLRVAKPIPGVDMGSARNIDYYDATGAIKPTIAAKLNEPAQAMDVDASGRICVGEFTYEYVRQVTREFRAWGGLAMDTYAMYGRKLMMQPLSEVLLRLHDSNAPLVYPTTKAVQVASRALDY